ncbi:MAG TPA: hypothetical protein VML96_11600 [Egibacteraceae bacterium]|nr:hypothetical protein [Egibacteraceae bacterium]
MRMHSGVWAAIRWLIAVAALGAVALVAAPRALEAMRNSISFAQSDPEPTDTPGAATTAAPEPVAPVSDGQARPFFDFHASGGAVADPLAEQLVIGADTGDALYLAFDAIEGDVGCLQTAQLHVPLQQATPATLGALPAEGVDPTQISEGDALPVPPTLGDTPAAPAITDGSPGILLWDVTPTYRAWVEGRTEDGAAPFVIVVRATGEDPDRELTFASSEAESPDGPLLSWTGVAGCGTEEGVDDSGDDDGEGDEPADDATEPDSEA